MNKSQLGNTISLLERKGNDNFLRTGRECDDLGVFRDLYYTSAPCTINN